MKRTLILLSFLILIQPPAKAVSRLVKYGIIGGTLGGIAGLVLYVIEKRKYESDLKNSNNNKRDLNEPKWYNYIHLWGEYGICSGMIFSAITHLRVKEMNEKRKKEEIERIFEEQRKEEMRAFQEASRIQAERLEREQQEQQEQQERMASQRRREEIERILRENEEGLHSFEETHRRVHAERLKREEQERQERMQAYQRRKEEAERLQREQREREEEMLRKFHEESERRERERQERERNQYYNEWTSNTNYARNYSYFNSFPNNNTGKNFFGNQDNQNIAMNLARNVAYELGVSPIAQPHEILGIHPHASTKEIETAYKNRIRKYHPDKHSNANEETKNLYMEISKVLSSAKDHLLPKETTNN